MPPQKPKARNLTPVSRKERRHSARRLLKYVFKYYPAQFLLVCVLVLFNSGAGVFGSYMLGNVLINVFVAPNGEIATSLSDHTWYGLSFGAVISIMAGVYLAGIIANYFYQFLMSIVAQGVQKRMRDHLFEHMEQLPVSYFDRRGHGDIMSIYTNDIDALREMLSRALPMLASSVVTMIVCFTLMLMSNFLLTAVVLGFSLLIILVSGYFAKNSSKYFTKQQAEMGRMNAYVEEMTQGQRVVKVFNYEKRNIAGFKTRNDQLFKDATKAQRYASVLMPTVNQLGNFQYVVVALLGGLAVINGHVSYSLTGAHLIEIGSIVSFLLFSKSFIQPIGQLSQQAGTVVMALAGASRIFAMMDEPIETDEGYVELVNAKEGEDGNPIETNEKTGKWAWKHPHKTGGVDYKWFKGSITFDDVDFAYIPGKTVLHNITLYAKPGQKVAFVGPTGAGKTTITNLINRFYDIEDGKVRYDDININKIKKADLRRSLGIVLQDTQLFTATVEENIRYGKPDATHEEVVAAAKLANADGFINLLPEGYDTVLTKAGMNLSQGQRQLLAIARAAIANPPVMILDEATSSIDSRTEQLVQEGMDRLMKGRTVFVIAHRLSTVKDSDVIMVIDQGHIIERGSHEELLEKKGKYYQLYTGNSING